MARNYYHEIKDKLINKEIYNRVKDYSKNKNDLMTYYEVGKLLSEAGKHYGEGIIKQYSVKLTNELGKGYTISALKRMRQFYEIIEKGAPLAHLLTWSHYIELLPLKDIAKINYYIDISIKQRLGRNALREKIKNREYERLDNKTKEKLINHEEMEVTDLIKNPVIIPNNGTEIITEKGLKIAILEHLDKFLSEIGNDFCYVGNEYKIKVGNTYNYIDLLLYNMNYNCYVVIELKTTELKKEHIGQIQVYMNYINKNLKRINQDNTIGIIICKKDNRYVMDYCSDERIFRTTFVIE